MTEDVAAAARSGSRRSLAFPGALLGLAFLIAPALADDLRPLCPDRPGKGTSPCTLDAGHFQVEIDLGDASFQHGGGVTTDTVVAVAPTLKYGLSDTLDLEAGITPYESVRSHDTASDATLSGFGDLYLRGKWNFWNSDSPFAAVIEPFVKIATATRGIGNGALEGGVVLPLSYDLGNGWSLASTPEADLLQDASGSGRHLSAIDVIGIGRSLGEITLGAELWTAQDFDPAAIRSQYSFDLDAAWQPGANLQLDSGVNLGLNRNTPGAQIYVGLSQRF